MRTEDAFAEGRINGEEYMSRGENKEFYKGATTTYMILGYKRGDGGERANCFSGTGKQKFHMPSLRSYYLPLLLLFAYLFTYHHSLLSQACGKAPPRPRHTSNPWVAL